MIDPIIDSALLETVILGVFEPRTEPNPEDPDNPIRLPLNEEERLFLAKWYYSNQIGEGAIRATEDEFRRQLSGFSTDDPTLLSLKVFEWVSKAQSAKAYVNGTADEFDKLMVEAEVNILNSSRARPEIDAKSYAHLILDKYQKLVCSLSVMTALRTYSHDIIQAQKTPEDCMKAFDRCKETAQWAATETAAGMDRAQVISGILERLNA
jgi:hypothetical protein